MGVGLEGVGAKRDGPCVMGTRNEGDVGSLHLTLLLEVGLRLFEMKALF